MIKLFELIDNITTAVDAVTNIEYVSDNLYAEIPADSFPAFIIDENVEMDMSKISVNGQIYIASMRTEFYLHVPYDSYSKAQFKTLYIAVLTAIGALQSNTVFQYINITDVHLLTPNQVGSEKTRTLFGTIEMMTKETFL